MTEAEGDAVVFLDSDDERDKTGDGGKGEEDEVNVEIVIQENSQVKITAIIIISTQGKRTEVSSVM